MEALVSRIQLEKHHSVAAASFDYERNITVRTYKNPQLMLLLN